MHVALDLVNCSFCLCLCRAPPQKQKVAEAGDIIETDLMEFRELQRVVSTYLEGNVSSEARLWWVTVVFVFVRASYALV